MAAAEDADLLVIGTGGHGEVVGTLLGSVREILHDPRQLPRRSGAP